MGDNSICKPLEIIKLIQALLNGMFSAKSEKGNIPIHKKMAIKILKKFVLFLFFQFAVKIMENTLVTNKLI